MGVFTILGTKSCKSICLEKINVSLTSVHCITHKNNLATLEGAKSPSCI
jgi:hypothetical protein